MSGGGAPKPDPQMGEAARMSAETGQEMMAFMKDQAEITNKWAADDRARYERDFVPLEAEYAADALAAQDKEKIGLNADQRASEAVADVRQQFSMQRDADNRRLRSMGVRPDSGRDAALASSRGSAEALATAGAANMGRRQSILQDEAKADGMRANAINMGKGMAVNPGTAMGISNGAAQAGFGGAMSGYGQQASILGKQHDAQMQAWSADQNMMGGFGSALGSVVGALPMMSSKDVKEDKRPAKGSLGAIRKMPVEKWKYKDGVADSGEHIGPYAEDFAKATGKGDGKTIDPISMMGVTLGAVQELDKKVSKMAGGKSA
ncbi:tail fiber domain-containing protein [Sulfitobacter sp. OXR-159]|uniref:tail fiber domain-containing protein n=1 Tax=Sulfitobacter sp. OXR-159 TaxID=3100174 RepID=UPI002AC961CE|nr:tail fiber domain-containing protein [Sulfitobacter sp. OXR-159]WPZ30765.1 tail fiber domain-containing protein [Sulfitobacter sp. OXR-159]WPZ30866.1 tail fiber domain-containing protein [Sulfitobacter sp. OXR-159]